MVMSGSIRQFLTAYEETCQALLELSKTEEDSLERHTDAILLSMLLLRRSSHLLSTTQQNALKQTLGEVSMSLVHALKQALNEPS